MAINQIDAYIRTNKQNAMIKQIILLLMLLCPFSFAPAFCADPYTEIASIKVGAKEGKAFLKHVFKSYIKVVASNSAKMEEDFHDEFMGYFDKDSKGSVDWELSMSANPKSLPDLFYMTGHNFVKPKVSVRHLDKSLFTVCVKGVRSFACRLRKYPSGRITILSLKAL